METGASLSLISSLVSSDLWAVEMAMGGERVRSSILGCEVIVQEFLVENCFVIQFLKLILFYAFFGYSNF